MIIGTDTMRATALPFAAPVRAVAGIGAVAQGTGAPICPDTTVANGTTGDVCPDGGTATGTGLRTAKLEQQWSNGVRHLGNPISAPARHLGRSPT